jgi:hypothetical protein
MIPSLTPGVYLVIFADDTHMCATNRKEGYVLRNLQRDLNSIETWCKRCNIKINKTRAIFSHRLTTPEAQLTLNNVTAVCESSKFLGIIFDKRITWRLHTEMIEASAFRTFIRGCFLLKSERLSTNNKQTPHKALIRSVMT